MKLVLALLIACSAVAEHDFSDEALTLLQLRSVATTHSSQPDLDSLQESAVAESEASDAKLLAQKALAQALNAESEAEEAETPVDDFSEDAPVPEVLLQKPKGRRGPSGCRIGKKGKKCRQAKKAKADADAAAGVAKDALTEATDANEKADEAAQKADEEVEVDPVPGQADEASAVGDPHMTLNTGDHKDLCCKKAVCKPCSFALLQKRPNGRKPNGECKKGKKGKKCRKAEKAKKDAKDALDLANQAVDEAQNAQNKASEAEQIVEDEAEVEEDVADEAAAVGDPHLTLSTGDKLDLCCEGGVCKAC